MRWMRWIDGLSGTLTMIIAVASCASRPPVALTSEGARVRVSAASEVAQCRSLGDFVAAGVTLSRGLPAPWASDQIRNAAGAKGATDVVFDDGALANAVGHAYVCP